MLNLVEEEDGSDDAIVEYSDPNLNNPFKIVQFFLSIYEGDNFNFYPF